MGFTLLLRQLRQLLQPKRLAVVEACIIGLVAALAAILLKFVVGWLGGWRVQVSHVIPAWIALPGVGLLGGFVAGFLVERVAPETSGSGVPQVKAVLSLVPIGLDLRVALVKLISGTLAIGSGLVLGREGPTIQVGSALAAQLSHWFPTSPDYRRQLIAAGASAGLAAAFNTPITGVLFVVEALLQDVSSFTLGTGILASFIGAVVSQQLGGDSLFSVPLTVSRVRFDIREIPLYVLLGVLAGIFGALFNRGILASLSINRRRLPLSLPWRVGLAGLISGGAIALLPNIFRDSTGLRTLVITGGASWELTAIAFATHFVLTLVAYGSGAPGGLSAPSLVLGSSLGYLVGFFANSSFGVGEPITYAMAGMSAFFSAVARTPITAVTIVFELTASFDLVLPLMVVASIAYFVAERLYSGSIYDRLLEWNGIHFPKSDSEASPLADLTAQDVMQQRVETLTSNMVLEQAVDAFARSNHRGFPVVADGQLVGIITQTDLKDLDRLRLSSAKTVGEIMTAQPITVTPQDKLADVLYLLNRYNLSRLPVTNGRKLVGIITRSDIIRAESDCLSGGKQEMGPRPDPSYVVYQTRAPATGKGRILVPIHNPQNATSLLQIAAAIAHDLHYEIDCLHVIRVNRDRPPDEAQVSTVASRRLLGHAQHLGRNWQIPMHTQIRVAHDPAQAILETIKERHIDITLMGWKGSTFTPGKIFGDVVDTILRQAACSVIFVKLDDRGYASDRRHRHMYKNLENPVNPTNPYDPNPQEHGDRHTKFGEQLSEQPGVTFHRHRPKLKIDRWLVPIAGGPNAQQAVKLLPGLISLSHAPEIRVCQVFHPADNHHDTSALTAETQFLSRKLSRRNGDCVVSSSVCAKTIPEAVLALAETYKSDAIILGASREGIFQQAIKGNIPEAIAIHSNCTVIIVRDALGE
ncbi:chloride channel protein [Pseudanabaena sp. PCC 6802]|uniref:chloride channel protein n=1 Tax=Pseudanabaena sp. PCC 6802 TaxID=118173 RepID=UPI000345F29A|nr:chloride channel protein [Pseudanabaena sp. PCC 6802]